jgi:hypothetical protein
MPGSVSPRDKLKRNHQSADLEPLEVLWRVMGLSGVVWECVWYRRGSGFEFRVQRDDNRNDVVAVRTFAQISEEMVTCAEQWLGVATAKGFVRLDD